MPNITVEGPVIREVAKKRELVKRLTEVAKDVYKIEHIVVLIKENPVENVGVDGVLVADRRQSGGS